MDEEVVDGSGEVGGVGLRVGQAQAAGDEVGDELGLLPQAQDLG